MFVNMCAQTMTICVILKLKRTKHVIILIKSQGRLMYLIFLKNIKKKKLGPTYKINKNF